MTKQEIQQRMERFGQICRERGIKRTHQRIEIYREVARATDHPSAEAILERVRKRLSSVSLDTVYRNLWLLTDLGLVTTLRPLREGARFDANLESHHHFVCTRCGLTSDFDDERFDSLEPPSSLASIGKIETTKVEVRGICKACSQRTR